MESRLEQLCTGHCRVPGVDFQLKENEVFSDPRCQRKCRIIRMGTSDQHYRIFTNRIPNLKQAASQKEAQDIKSSSESHRSKNHPCAYYSEPPINRITNLHTKLEENILSEFLTRDPRIKPHICYFKWTQASLPQQATLYWGNGASLRQ